MNKLTTLNIQDNTGIEKNKKWNTIAKLTIISISAILVNGCKQIPITIINNWGPIYLKKQKDWWQKKIIKSENEKQIEILRNLTSETLEKINKTTNSIEKERLQKDYNFYLSSLLTLTKIKEKFEKDFIRAVNIWFNWKYIPKNGWSYKQRINTFRKHKTSYKYSKTLNFKFRKKEKLEQLDWIYYTDSRERFDWYLENSREIILDFIFNWKYETFSFLLQDHIIKIIHLKTWEIKNIFLNKKIQRRFWYRNWQDEKEIIFWDKERENKEIGLYLNLKY